MPAYGEQVIPAVPGIPAPLIPKADDTVPKVNRRGNTPEQVVAALRISRHAAQLRYRAKHRDRIAFVRRERMKAHYAANPRKFLDRSKAWRIANRERVLVKDRRKYAVKREQKKAEQRARNIRDREKIRESRRRYYASGRGAAIDLAKKALLRNLKTVDSVAHICFLRLLPFCQYCFTLIPNGKVTIDHVIAMARGGAHEPHNLVAACRKCNASKGAKSLEEWGGRTYA